MGKYAATDAEQARSDETMLLGFLIWRMQLTFHTPDIISTAADPLQRSSVNDVIFARTTEFTAAVGPCRLGELTSAQGPFAES